MKSLKSLLIGVLIGALAAGSMPAVADVVGNLVLGSAGTQFAPVLTFLSDAKKGLYDAGSNAIGVVVNQIEGLRVTQSTAQDVEVAARNRMVFGRLGDPAPAINTCGTATVVGTDASGKVVITGGTPTSCTVNFAKTWLVAPACFATNETTLNALPVASASTTVLTISRQVGITGVAANFGTDTLKYWCVGQG